MFTAAQIEAIGATPWTRPGTTEIRYYINNWAELLDLRVSRYNSGNISSATLRGEPISNARARRILAGDPKVWWADGELHATGELVNHLGALAEAITGRVGAGPETEAAPPAAEPAPVPAVEPLPAGHIRIRMPRGPAGTHTVDLTILSPMARALAEAIAATPYRWVRLRSIAPAVELYTGDPQQIRQWLGATADQLQTRSWEGWAVNPTPSARTVAQILEDEARKIVGWYPIAEDGTDLPSSQAARHATGRVAA